MYQVPFSCGEVVCTSYAQRSTPWKMHGTESKYVVDLEVPLEDLRPPLRQPGGRGGTDYCSYIFWWEYLVKEMRGACGGCGGFAGGDERGFRGHGAAQATFSQRWLVASKRIQPPAEDTWKVHKTPNPPPPPPLFTIWLFNHITGNGAGWSPPWFPLASRPIPHSSSQTPPRWVIPFFAGPRHARLSIFLSLGLPKPLKNPGSDFSSHKFFVVQLRGALRAEFRRSEVRRAR